MKIQKLFLAGSPQASPGAKNNRGELSRATCSPRGLCGPSEHGAAVVWPDPAAGRRGREGELGGTWGTAGTERDSLTHCKPGSVRPAPWSMLSSPRMAGRSRGRVLAEALKGGHARPGAAPAPRPALLPKCPPDPASPNSRGWGHPRVIRAWGQHATGPEVGLGLFLPVAKAGGDKNSPHLTGSDPHPRPRQLPLF